MFVNLRPRDVVTNLDSASCQWQWRYDDAESALEICQEFQALLLHDINYADRRRTYLPISKPSYPHRVSRRFRKAGLRERASKQRMLRCNSYLLSGSFPTELEDDDLCDIHYERLGCWKCDLHRQLKRQRDKSGLSNRPNNHRRMYREKSLWY